MSIAVYLPARALVTVTAATNAEWTQRVTLEYGDGHRIEWEGGGGGNHRIGQTDIVTPRGPVRPYSFEVRLSIEHLHPTDGWRVSRVQEDCEPRTVGGWTTIFVWSEDGGPDGEDWDDTVVRFTWFEGGA